MAKLNLVNVFPLEPSLLYSLPFAQPWWKYIHIQSTPGSEELRVQKGFVSIIRIRLNRGKHMCVNNKWIIQLIEMFSNILSKWMYIDSFIRVSQKSW